MKNRLRFWILMFSVILLAGFKIMDGLDLEGKWQSLNDSSAVLEFTKDNKIILYKNNQSFWALVSKHGELDYTISKERDNWFNLVVMDGNELFIKGKIEIVNKDRIRVYFYKHHDILDIADEYHRTMDFDSFNRIMKEILEEPDTIYFKK